MSDFGDFAAGLLGAAAFIDLAIFGGIAAYLLWRRKRKSKAHEVGVEEFDKSLLDSFPQPLMVMPTSDPKVISVREAVTVSGPRHEIKLTDWGPEHEEMRWRYTIWDADVYVKLALGWDGVQLVPETLGNAPTREAAERAALDWVYAHDGRESWVVSN